MIVTAGHLLAGMCLLGAVFIACLKLDAPWWVFVVAALFIAGA